MARANSAETIDSLDLNATCSRILPIARRSSFEQTGGIANNDRPRRDVSDHDASRANHGISADSTPWKNCRASADKSARAYAHLAREDRAGSDVDAIRDDALMVDHRAGIDNDGTPQMRLRPNERAGEDLRASPNRRIACDPRPRVNDA